MNGVIYSITVEQMKSLISAAGGLSLDNNQMEALTRSAKNSNPLFAGMYGAELACIIGLVPPTLISSDAYIWMLHTTVVDRHKVSFGRHAIRLVRNLRQRYSRIVGHCMVTDKSAIGWIKSFGATIFDFDDNLIWFEIK